MSPKAVLVNIYGGITRCDIVAEAIIQALNDFKNTPPMVIRLMGTKDTEGIALLNNEGLHAYQDVMKAIKAVKEVLKK